jgi:hypothetical protein
MYQLSTGEVGGLLHLRQVLVAKICKVHFYQVCYALPWLDQFKSIFSNEVHLHLSFVFAVWTVRVEFRHQLLRVDLHMLQVFALDAGLFCSLG